MGQKRMEFIFLYTPCPGQCLVLLPLKFAGKFLDELQTGFLGVHKSPFLSSFTLPHCNPKHQLSLLAINTAESLHPFSVIALSLFPFFMEKLYEVVISYLPPFINSSSFSFVILILPCLFPCL